MNSKQQDLLPDGDGLVDALPLPEPGVLIRIGRARTFHRARVAIRDMKVIVVTQCGIERDFVAVNLGGAEGASNE